MNKNKPVIIGGGPAGLAVAYNLGKMGIPGLVIEKDSKVGGLCKTVTYSGFRCDIGGHRFFTKSKEVLNLWNSMLGNDFLLRPRLSRIYYRSKFFHYPLHVGNALASLGPCTSLRVILSYFKSHLFPISPEISFDDWVSNRFGRILYSIFFKSYTEKVWGIPCTQLSADWAAQRIRNLSLGKAVLDAMGIGKDGKVTSLTEHFHYPKLGPGQMYEAMAGKIIRQGGEVQSGLDVVEVQHDQAKISGLRARGAEGDYFLQTSNCFSSMPITELVKKMRPLPPEQVLNSARSLRYRSIIVVTLLLMRPTSLPDNWIYLHAAEVRAGRLQLFENWSPFMVPGDGRSSASFEYFCFEGDSMWNQTDTSLIHMAKEDLIRLDLVEAYEIFDAFVVRYAKAYPMYEDGYEKHLHLLKDWLSQFSNLHCIGRYGQFRYNNMDHSILTGIRAARCMLGEDVDPWSVNADAEYLEENR